MQIKHKIGDVVRVEWEDSWTDSTKVYSLAGINEEKPFVGRAVGEIVRNNKSGITLAHESFTEGHFRLIHHIPRYMIRKVKNFGPV